MVVGSALFHFVNGCPAMVQSPTRWNQFVARTLGGPGHSLRGRSLLRGRTVRRSPAFLLLPEVARWLRPTREVWCCLPFGLPAAALAVHVRKERLWVTSPCCSARWQRAFQIG